MKPIRQEKCQKWKRNSRYEKDYNEFPRKPFQFLVKNLLNYSYSYEMNISGTRNSRRLERHFLFYRSFNYTLLGGSEFIWWEIIMKLIIEI